MAFNRFGFFLTLRLAVEMVLLTGVGFLIITPGYHAATFLGLLVAIGLGYEIFRFVSKTNQELSRFLNAARYADFGQRFQFRTTGAGFAELGETFTHILDRFREDRKQQESELRHLKALTEHVPVPLISVYADGTITLWNNSARRLFGITQVRKMSDLAPFGDDFLKQVRAIQAGEQVLVSFKMEDVDVQLMLTASEITVASSMERLISLQNIQNELDGMQINAWQDLVRVLTHEIMNSITPVASLAKTAADLVNDVSLKVSGQTDVVRELQDVKDAVKTVARRSDGLMHFVSSYRQLTRLPAPEKSRFLVKDLFADVSRMVRLEWQNKKFELHTHIEPGELDIFADREMIEQLLLNLLQNCTHAFAGMDKTGRVSLSSKLNKRGHVTIEVSDNGPGISPEIATRIFVPFYTTRKEGSGVGLALSRQVMIAHRGTISFANNERGGARFTLAF